MGEEKFAEFSKALASGVSRRQALKLAGATALGGALSLLGARGAGGQVPGRCRRVGVPCRQSEECCEYFCDPNTGRCACPPGLFTCRHTRRCVTCRPPGVFNPETCQCECPEGTTACDGSCCTAEETCCVNFYGGATCCPPGVACCPGGYCDYYGYGC
ncbi:MAG: hypothetical protein M3327_07615 [Actinomycetota bacterium]|nr:hypothetical protein [Actinomycetota bacterium]